MPELIVRKAPLTPSSIDLEARTVQAVASTGAPVQRGGVTPDGDWGPWIEELNVPGADLSAFNNAPVLLDHIQLTDRQVGIVERAWIANGQLLAQLRFGRSDAAESIWRDVQGGILGALSVGYRVHPSDWQNVGNSPDGMPIWRAAAWQPLELSFVSLPADAGARIRSASSFPATPSHSGTEVSMPETQPTAPASLGVPDQQQLERSRREAAEAETTRIRSITTAARTLGLEQHGDILIRNGSSLEQAQREMIAMLEQNQRASGGAPRPAAINVLRDSGDTARRGLSEYVAARLRGRRPQKEGEMFTGMRMVDALRSGLEARGEGSLRTASADEVIGRALSTSDLPVALQGGSRRVLMDIFPTYRTPLLQLCETINLSDFRETTLLRIGAHKPLSPVVEHGGVTYAYPVEASEKAKLQTFANNFAFTREAIINDDLGALSLFLRSAAAAAAETERQQIVALLASNSGVGPVLNDGLNWFDASRGNTGTAGAPDTTTLAEAIKLLRTLKDPNGSSYLTLQPKVLVAGPLLELPLRQLLSETTRPTTYGSTQPFADLDIVIENSFGPTLSRWWLAGDPATQRSITVGYLDGNETPTVETFSEPDMLGMTMRLTFDVVAAVNDWRGWVTNPGA